MSDIQGKTVVIIGASSGIGEATARLLAAQGFGQFVNIASIGAHAVYPTATAIAYAIGQPADMDISELIVRPTASPY